VKRTLKKKKRPKTVRRTRRFGGGRQNVGLGIEPAHKCAAYDGKVFNTCFSDLPEKKIDLKIIDMLGEEVLITEELRA
jgi:hypothetical protein